MRNTKQTEQTAAMHYIKAFGIGIVGGFIILFLLLIVFAAVVSAIDLPPYCLNVFSMIGLSAAGFITGSFTTHRIKRKGMLYGALSGILFALVVLLVGLFCNTPFSGMIFAKTTVVIFFALCGGIFGVNRKKLRR